MWPWSTKAVISSTGIFVAIANNTLYGSQLAALRRCINHNFKKCTLMTGFVLHVHKWSSKSNVSVNYISPFLNISVSGLNFVDKHECAHLLTNHCAVIKTIHYSVKLYASKMN